MEVENLNDLREARLDELACPGCGKSVRVYEVEPSWCWNCRACRESGLWFSTKEEAEDHLLRQTQNYISLEELL